jgi:hypothetical protein
MRRASLNDSRKSQKINSLEKFAESASHSAMLKA